jgi:hypothetical protein
MTEETNERPTLMPISKEGIPGALSKAERYRLLNDAWQAESICLDVLAVDPANQLALILLVLSMTDQFERGLSSKQVSRILEIVERLTDEYHRAYYSGIVVERQAIAMFRYQPDYRSRKQVQTLFQSAMESYRLARAIQPPNNDEATLRWNACVRFLERNWGLQ